MLAAVLLGLMGAPGLATEDRATPENRAKLEKAAEQHDGSGAKVYDCSWKSLERYKCPEWFRDAKFGVYVHWGVYSVPGQGCWYGRNLYDRQRPEHRHHRATHGHPSEFGYHDFIPQWKAERFDADAWLAMIKASGARYFTPCATHHDGFDLWDSPHPFSATRMGPECNLLKEMMEATRKTGLRWGVTTHLARNYNFFQTGYSSDPNGPKKGVPYIADTPLSRAFYHENHGDTNPKYPKNPSSAWKQSWSGRVTDLIDRYELDFLYFDGAIPFDTDDGFTGRNVLARFYNQGIARHGHDHQVVMTIKTARGGHGIYREGVATLDLERHKLDQLRDAPWQTDDTIGRRYWSHVPGMEYQTPDYLIDKFVDIVSKNGNLLLSLPPRADGTFDPEVHDILREIGRWNRENGEAVFGTRPWRRFGEGDARLTRSKDGRTLYAIFLEWPDGGRASLKSLARSEPAHALRVRAATLLGAGVSVPFSQDADGLHLEIPKRTNPYAVAVKLELRQPVESGE